MTPNCHEVFEQNRSWFLISFMVMCLLDLPVSGQRDGRIPEPFYLAFVGHYAVIALLGYFYVAAGMTWRQPGTSRLPWGYGALSCDKRSADIAGTDMTRIP